MARATPRSHRRESQRATSAPWLQVKDLPQRPSAALKVKGGSPQLMLACASGQHIKEATITTRPT